MKKYNAVFLLSFISYFMVLFASPYITAQTWADIFLLVFLISVIYQLLYIIVLRKKDGVSLGRSISKFFLYALSAVSCYIAVEYIDIFINGYKETAFLSGELIAVYYGFDAWINNFWYNIFFAPFLILNILYAIIYFAVIRSIKKKIKYD